MHQTKCPGLMIISLLRQIIPLTKSGEGKATERDCTNSTDSMSVVTEVKQLTLDKDSSDTRYNSDRCDCSDR